MQRPILLAMLTATLMLAVPDAANAQFGIGIGVGRGSRYHNDWRFRYPLNPKHHTRDHDGNRFDEGWYELEERGWKKVEPQEQPAREQVKQPWHGASHVATVDDPRYQGVYFERDNKDYFTDGEHEPQLVSHGGFHHVDDLAARLELLANELCLDLHYNYRHNPGFRYTYKDVYDVYQLAKYIHGLKQEGKQEEIARRLDGLDKLFHYVRTDVREWSLRRDRQIGGLTMPEKIERIQSTVHHLMNDVGVKEAAIVEEAPKPQDLVDVPPLP